MLMWFHTQRAQKILNGIYYVGTYSEKQNLFLFATFRFQVLFSLRMLNDKKILLLIFNAFIFLKMCHVSSLNCINDRGFNKSAKKLG